MQHGQGPMVTPYAETFPYAPCYSFLPSSKPAALDQPSTTPSELLPLASPRVPCLGLAKKSWRFCERAPVEPGDPRGAIQGSSGWLTAHVSQKDYACAATICGLAPSSVPSNTPAHVRSFSPFIFSPCLPVRDLGVLSSTLFLHRNFEAGFMVRMTD